MAASGNNAQDAPDLLTILNNPGDDMVNPFQILGSSDYLVDELINYVGNGKTLKHKALHLNIHSLPDKFDRLRILLS